MTEPIYTGKQDQHLISKVYLKQFSYLKGNQEMICVRKIREKFNRNKSIKSFLTEVNTFDIKSINPRIQRIYESELNGELESEYPNIINEISSKKTISDKSEAYLKQFTANLFCRSPFHRNIFKSKLKDRIFKQNWLGIFSHMLKSDTIFSFKNEEIDNMIDNLSEVDSDESFNPIMMLYTMLFSRFLYQMDMVILENPNNNMTWFTSDNPIILKRNSSNDTDIRIINEDSEIYFPLSPNFLAYFKYKNSEKKGNLRLLKHKEIIKIDEQTINYITSELIIPNVYEYLISPVKI